MRTLLRHRVNSGIVHALYSEVADGDFADQSDDVQLSRDALVPLPWSWTNQVHGARVLTVTSPGEHAGAEADALATLQPLAVLSVRTADCAPVIFVSEGGAIAIAHAGWRGLEAGVLSETAETVRSLSSGDVWAILGPCIHACCYEFGAADLDRLSASLGSSVRSTDRSGNPALDLVAAVSAALGATGVELREVVDRCTEEESFWSYRLRKQNQRMTTCIWIEP